MTDQRPSGGARSELRRTVQPWDTDIPLISADPFSLDADLIIGDEEYIRCTSRSEHWLLGCARGLRPEDGGVPARKWLGGTTIDQVPWTTTEITTEYPTVVTDAMVGRDFAWDAGDGNVYRYHVVRIEGTPVVVWDDEPPATGMAFLWASAITGLTNISGVALDASGNIYTTRTTTTNSMQKFSPALAQLWTQNIAGLTHTATDGTTVLASTQTSIIAKRLASTGAAGSPASFGAFGTGDGQFHTALGIAFDGTSAWVVDTGNNRVQKFTVSTGAYVSQFDGSTSGLAFSAPTSIAIGPTSTHLYILDPVRGRVVKHLKSDHSWVATFDLGTGTADGQISTTAEGIALDATGRIWISDTGNHRVQVFDSAGVFLGKVGEFGGGDDKFKSPKQIAFNAAGDTAYVADSGNNRLVTLQEDTSGGGTTGYTVGPLVVMSQRDDGVGTLNAAEWTNMPNAATELYGLTQHRREVDLTDLTQYFFLVSVDTAGAAAAVLNLEYTSDLTGATGWTSMAGGTLSLAAASQVSTGWATIPTGARAAVLLRVMGSGGNGTADPRLEHLAVQFRGVGVQGPQGPAGAPGATTTPGGATTQVQFNDGGAFGGDSDFIWDKINNRLGISTGAPDYTLDIVATESTPNVGSHIAGYSAMYNLGGANPNAVHGGIWPQEARMGFTVARKFSSGGGADGPTAALTAHIESNMATSSGVALMTTAQVTAANGVAFGGNLIALADNVAGAKLVGLEIDVEPFAGQTVSAASGGLFLNAFNVDMTNAPALFVNGFTTGRWGYGLLLNGITQNGVGVTIQSGAPEMEWGIHLNNGTFGTAAAQFGAQNDKPALILNQGVSATTANILEVKDATSAHTFFSIAGGNSGNWGSKSKASTDHVATLDATTAGRNVGLVLRDAGTDKWTVLKNGANDFQIYNGALGAGAITVSPTSAVTLAGNLTVSKSDAALALVSTNAGNSQLSIYDTTDGGVGIFNQDGAFRFCHLNSAGSFVANRIEVAVGGAVTIDDLSGTGVRAVNASATGVLSASALTGIIKQTSGVASVATAGTDYYNPGGTDVAVADGGTGASSALAGFNALSPLTTQGDLLTRDGTNNIRLAKGTTLQRLRMNVGATDVEWGDNDDLVARFRLTADGSAIGATIANFFGTNSAFPTAASTIYLVIADCYFTKTTAGTVVWTLTSSVNYTACAIGFDNPGVLTGNAGSVGAATAAVTLASGSLTTAVKHYMKVVALVETNTAGNIRLNVTQSAGTVTPLRGSLYRIYRVPSGNLGSFVA